MFHIPTVPTSDELLDKAFRRALRAKGSKSSRAQVDETMLRTASKILSDNLYNVVKRFPNFDTIPNFYRETIDILIGVDKLKMSLSSINWASDKISQISRSAIAKIRRGHDSKALRQQAYGRIGSIMRDIKKDLDFLNDARNKIMRLPQVIDEPTILVAGYPNVGKSSFVSFVTSAKPRIAQYPFTTQEVSVGHLEYQGRRYQVVDLPGLLDRPLSHRNKIERQAISALKYLGNVVLFLVDPTETCGYLMTDQLNLLAELKSEFSIPFIIALNKCDLHLAASLVEGYRISTINGRGISKLLKALTDVSIQTGRVPKLT